MKKTKRVYGTGFLLVVAALISMTTAINAGDDTKPKNKRRATATQRDTGDNLDNVSDDESWIGVMLVPVSDALKAHLDLEWGLIVERVVPNSPAADAGITVHDILLAVDGVPIDQPEDLMDAITNVDGGAVTIQLLRDGKEKSVEVTPARRPEGSIAIRVKPGADRTFIRDWIRQFQEGGEGAPWRFQFVRPGFALPGNVELKLPAGVSVSVKKEGDQPAKVSVKKDDKTWEVTEENVDELPDEVQPFVKRMLGKGVHAKIEVPAEYNDDWLDAIPSDKIRSQIELWWKNRPSSASQRDLPKFNVPDDIQQQLDNVLENIRNMQSQLRNDGSLEEMRRELKSLREEVDELRRKSESKEGT